MKLGKNARTIIAIVAGLGMLGGGAAYAANSQQRPQIMTNLVNAIAQKFNLNTSEVQQLVDEQIAQHQTQQQERAQQRFADRLAKAVGNGELTQQQTDLITAKQAEIKTIRDELRGKTPDEIRAAMQNERDSLRQWAEDNDIPLHYLMFGGPEMGMHRGMFGGQRGVGPAGMPDQQ